MEDKRITKTKRALKSALLKLLTTQAFDVISINELPHKLGVSCEGFPKFFVSTNNSISSTQNI